MKLTSQNYIKREYANQTVMFPIIGTVRFDNEGNLDVDDDKVDQFITATNDPFAFAPLDKKDNKKITAELALVEPEDMELRTLLDASGIKELAEMAMEVKINLQDIANMTDAKLRIVLYNKIKELEKSQPKQPTTPSNTTVKKKGKLAKNKHVAI